MSAVELFQFRFSHYNEKARWALDWKRVPHVRHSYLPGLHIVPIRRLTGQNTMPVLRDDTVVISGSAAIVDHLERRHPTRPLYPADSAARSRALEIQRWFDEEVGALMRAAFFYEVLPEGGYAASLFSRGSAAPTRLLFRALFPATRVVMRKSMDLTAARAGRGLARAAEAFEFVVKHAGTDGYLVGDTFSVADLTAAALLSPAVMPREFPYQPKQPMGRAFQGWLARWAGHRGAEWVRTMYARHRGSSAEVAAADPSA